MLRDKLHDFVARITAPLWAHSHAFTNNVIDN